MFENLLNTLRKIGVQHRQRCRQKFADLDEVRGILARLDLDMRLYRELLQRPQTPEKACQLAIAYRTKRLAYDALALSWNGRCQRCCETGVQGDLLLLRREDEYKN